MSTSTPRGDRTVLGIGLAFLGFASFSASDAMTKVLTARYSIYQLAITDAVFAALLIIPFIVRAEGWASLRPRRPWAVLARGALGAAALILCFMSISRIPLADAYSIGFIAPLAVTAMSAPILGEHVGWRQWAAVLIGFGAVLAILRPDLGAVGIGQFYMLISALVFAVSLLILRRVAPTERSGGLMVSYLALLFLMGLPAAIADWRSPESLPDLGLMIGMGLFSGLGNILVIYATRAAPAAIVSSFMYTQLVWGCLLGLALFGDTPDRMTLMGAAVIIGCGLYTLSLASRRARALVEPA